ncbi:hypothetical protein LIER_00843 [Lithospermum erythrorhizon]|uniref:Uncharacterized protein n=1 Tax=Lithospermum erythrorhizon TaxID=34254 RepID=A0AAV3NIT9_LITER
MENNSTFWVEDTDGQYTFSRKRNRGANKKLEFVGWGSRPLIEFLNSVGNDTTKPLSQHEVTTIVKEYINVNNLPLKKRRFQCDDRLYTIFGKSVPRLKIYDSLEKHFAENHDESEDEEDSSEEENGDILSGKGKKTATLGKKISQGKTNATQTSKSCFAAVIIENIKLVYLKRSLVLQLLKISDGFEEKVKDSFVRIKSDRNDYLQKLPYHLEQVTGLKRVSEVGSDGTDIQLLVTNSVIGVPLKMLSEDNFSEEECVDLRERIKAGLVKRPTVVELSAKAKMLHEDIIKHWIPREIAQLQARIDRANEKGWRKEYPLSNELVSAITCMMHVFFTLYEYLQKRELLKTDAEQQRLLLHLPEVVAEELEPVDPPTTSVDNSIGAKGNSSSPNSTLRGLQETSSLDASGMIDPCNVPQSVIETEEKSVPQVEENLIKSTENSGGADSRGVSERQVMTMPVIELSDDEEAEKGIQKLDDNHGLPTKVEKPDNEVEKRILGPEDAIWYYSDPQNQTQGPFTIQSLKSWNDLGYFPSQFKVWRAGENEEQAIFLADAIYYMFSLRAHSRG